MNQYIVAAVGDWNRKIFEKIQGFCQGDWFFVDNPKCLYELINAGVNPRYIFFPHWRWIVPPDLTNEYECVCFHMTDVPYGRGGSPLQNLIVRGHTSTVLTALRMDEGMDAGPVYKKQALDLSGSAYEIYQRASKLSFDFMRWMVVNEPLAVAQSGEPVTFSRRKPEDSEIPLSTDLAGFYDYVRMLDAPDYPPAYIRYGDFNVEFKSALLAEGEITATVRIRKK